MENVKELWIRLSLRGTDFPAGDMVCYGCRPENACAYMDLCECIREKGVKNCGLCNEYPCELINATLDQSESERFRSHASSVCTQEEMDLLSKAFFFKKEYFDKIYQKHHNK